MMGRSISAAVVVLFVLAVGNAQAQSLVAPASSRSGPGFTPMMASPWLWVSTGQPLLMSPLWASSPAYAAMSPAPWGLWETAYHRGRNPAYRLTDNAEAHLGSWSSAVSLRGSSVGTINWNVLTVLNSGDSHAR